MLTGLPGVTVVSTASSADGVRPGTATYRLTGTVNVEPGTYPVTVSFTAPGGQTATSAFSIVVTPEDALAVYTGPTTFSSDPAAPPSRLSANLTDVDDGSRGDIRTAIVKFVNQATGARLCVSDVTGGPLQGTGSCNAAVASGVTVGMVVLGRYTGPITAPDTTIVSGPKDRSFVTTRKVTFKLGSTVSGSTFTCSLDGKSLPCDGVDAAEVQAGHAHVQRCGPFAPGHRGPTPATRVFAAPFNDGQLSGHRGLEADQGQGAPTAVPGPRPAEGPGADEKVKGSARSSWWRTGSRLRAGGGHAGRQEAEGRSTWSGPKLTKKVLIKHREAGKGKLGDGQDRHAGQQAGADRRSRAAGQGHDVGALGRTEPTQGDSRGLGFRGCASLGG